VGVACHIAHAPSHSGAQYLSTVHQMGGRISALPVSCASAMPARMYLHARGVGTVVMSVCGFGGLDQIVQLKSQKARPAVMLGYAALKKMISE
jgi:hypothetical protein